MSAPAPASAESPLLDVRDVQGAVRWAVGHNVQMRPRSGGHSYAGYSTLQNGVVLDLRKMRSISVNRRVGLGPGSLVGEASHANAP